MKKLLKANLYFLIPYFIFIVFSGILLFSFSKTELHILSNKANSTIFDLFFKNATYLGDGALIVVLFVILLFVKYRFAFAFLVGSLSTALIVNLFKKILLNNMYRPSKYFELFETYKLHFVEGVNLHAVQSFPSGHTATAFNIFFMMALLAKSNMLKLVFFIISLLVAYSRVYLSQHFLIDITIGSVFGVFFIMLFWFIFEKCNKQWMENSILKKGN